MTKNETRITKDAANKTMHVVREFNAPVDQVWKAWTDSTVMDEWWAPKPWKAETKSQDFKEGGSWVYSMVGPEGERHWALFNYETIEPGKSFTGVDAFSDEHGNISSQLPSMHWRIMFTPSSSGTRVEIAIRFETEEDMQKITEMGFQEGFTMAHGNLDELLAR